MMAIRIEEYVGRKIIDEPECLKDSPISGTYRVELSDEEIIRCLDCIQSHEVEGDIACAMFSRDRDCIVEPDGFCAWAERRQ